MCVCVFKSVIFFTFFRSTILYRNTYRTDNSHGYCEENIRRARLERDMRYRVGTLTAHYINGQTMCDRHRDVAVVYSRGFQKAKIRRNTHRAYRHISSVTQVV